MLLSALIYFIGCQEDQVCSITNLKELNVLEAQRSFVVAKKEESFVIQKLEEIQDGLNQKKWKFIQTVIKIFYFLI